MSRSLSNPAKNPPYFLRTTPAISTPSISILQSPPLIALPSVLVVVRLNVKSESHIGVAGLRAESDSPPCASSSLLLDNTDADDDRRGRRGAGIIGKDAEDDDDDESAPATTHRRRRTEECGSPHDPAYPAQRATPLDDDEYDVAQALALSCRLYIFTFTPTTASVSADDDQKMADDEGPVAQKSTTRIQRPGLATGPMSPPRDPRAWY
ncbi:hypothetical protein C8F01DRAFT_1144030 [Mycena amicta]|nr:hypothetical protein C8F01DRAFT_1144030 [Mycena amicta]